MRSGLTLVMALAGCVLIPLSVIHADESPSDQYLVVYNKMHQAEMLEREGDLAGAIKGFQDCYDSMTKIQKEDPKWEPDTIKYRMKDCQVAIAKLQAQIAPPTNAVPLSH